MSERVINKFDVVKHFKGHYYIVLDICQLIPRYFKSINSKFINQCASNCDNPDELIIISIDKDKMNINIFKELNNQVSLFKNVLLSDEFVIYKDLITGRIWVRKYKEFISEVNHEKYPDVKQKYRFELYSQARKISE